MSLEGDAAARGLLDGDRLLAPHVRSCVPFGLSVGQSVAGDGIIITDRVSARRASVPPRSMRMFATLK